ncbi:MAG: STAS domain-containing protein [Gammaproteobacteria bacterium]|jgi:phospholipid transport system transporter-binding protein|nr:STAS domain-containing protein [Gammaproteobacteria bacterium]
MNVARIEPAGDRRFRVSGVLDYGTVATLEARGHALFAAVPDALVDLSGVERANSAGLALLLEWVDRARAERRRLRYEAVPASLVDIARMSNAVDLLPLVPTGGGTT